MLPFEDRYTRQRRLAEVGPDGQCRLEAAVQVLAQYDGVEVEADYLRRAGVHQISLGPDARPLEFPWAEHFQFAGPAAVARGAHGALARIRAILERSG